MAGRERDDETYELPKAVVNRLVKNVLPEGVQIQKEATLALAKAAKIWVHYATACANDFCLNSNRSTISANDVLMAMDELEFNHFEEPLKEMLEGIKKENATKKEARKKQKVGATAEKQEEGAAMEIEKESEGS